MAKQYIDASVTTVKESMTKEDGTALTLSGQVRIQERINELELQ